MMQELYIIIGGLIVGAIGWFTAMAAGRKQEKANQIKRENKARVIADEARKEIDSLSDDDILNRSKRWVRNPKQ